MTPAVIFLLVGGSCLFLLIGAYIVGVLLIRKWSEIQKKEREKREAFWSKLMDKAKAQFRSSMQQLPERTSKVALEFVKKLETESVMPEVIEE